MIAEIELEPLSGQSWPDDAQFVLMEATADSPTALPSESYALFPIRGSLSGDGEVAVRVELTGSQVRMRNPDGTFTTSRGAPSAILSKGETYNLVFWIGRDGSASTDNRAVSVSGVEKLTSASNPLETVIPPGPPDVRIASWSYGPCATLEVSYSRASDWPDAAAKLRLEVEGAPTVLSGEDVDFTATTQSAEICEPLSFYYVGSREFDIDVDVLDASDEVLASSATFSASVPDSEFDAFSGGLDFTVRLSGDSDGYLASLSVTPPGGGWPRGEQYEVEVEVFDGATKIGETHSVESPIQTDPSLATLETGSVNVNNISLPTSGGATSYALRAFAVDADSRRAALSVEKTVALPVDLGDPVAAIAGTWTWGEWPAIEISHDDWNAFLAAPSDPPTATFRVLAEPGDDDLADVSFEVSRRPTSRSISFSADAPSGAYGFVPGESYAFKVAVLSASEGSPSFSAGSMTAPSAPAPRVEVAAWDVAGTRPTLRVSPSSGPWPLGSTPLDREVRLSVVDGASTYSRRLDLDDGSRLPSFYDTAFERNLPTLRSSSASATAVVVDLGDGDAALSERSAAVTILPPGIAVAAATWSGGAGDDPLSPILTLTYARVADWPADAERILVETLDSSDDSVLSRAEVVDVEFSSAAVTLDEFDNDLLSAISPSTSYKFRLTLLSASSDAPLRTPSVAPATTSTAASAIDYRDADATTFESWRRIDDPLLSEPLYVPSVSVSPPLGGAKWPGESARIEFVITSDEDGDNSRDEASRSTFSATPYFENGATYRIEATSVSSAGADRALSAGIGSYRLSATLQRSDGSGGFVDLLSLGEIALPEIAVDAEEEHGISPVLTRRLFVGSRNDQTFTFRFVEHESLSAESLWSGVSADRGWKEALEREQVFVRVEAWAADGDLALAASRIRTGLAPSGLSLSANMPFLSALEAGRRYNFVGVFGYRDADNGEIRVSERLRASPPLSALFSFDAEIGETWRQPLRPTFRATPSGASGWPSSADEAVIVVEPQVSDPDNPSYRFRDGWTSVAISPSAGSRETIEIRWPGSSDARYPFQPATRYRFSLFLVRSADADALRAAEDLTAAKVFSCLSGG